MRHRARRYPTPAHNYHYDNTNGLDTNTGTADKPLKTFANANAKAFLPGDRVYFKCGESWAERLTPPTHGTKSRPILFTQYGSGTLPTINTPTGGVDCINIDGKRHIFINGFITTGAGANAWKTGVAVVQGSHYCIIENVESHTNNLYGFDVDSSKWVITKNCIGRNSVEGINHRNGADQCFVLGGTYHTNSNKNVESEGGGEVTAIGVTGYASGKESFHSRYTGSRLICINCLSYGAGTVDASSGVGFNAREAGYLYVLNCVAYGNTRYGIQCWDGTPVVEAYHCTLYDGVYGVGMFAGTLTMKNCTLSLFNWGQAIVVDTLAGTVTLDYNNYHQGNWTWRGTDNSTIAAHRTTSGQDANSVVGDPLFVNTGTKDFHLQSASPSKNAGTNLGFINDKDGVARSVPHDMGAFEYV